MGPRAGTHFPAWRFHPRPREPFGWCLCADGWAGGKRNATFLLGPDGRGAGVPSWRDVPGVAVFEYFCGCWLCLLAVGTFGGDVLVWFLQSFLRFRGSVARGCVFRCVFLCLSVVLSLWVGGEPLVKSKRKILCRAAGDSPLKTFSGSHMNYEIPKNPHPTTSISVCR